MEKDKIIEKARQYGLRADWAGENLYIYSNYIDEWYISTEDNKLVLHHKNLRGNSQVSKHYHIQKEYRVDEYDKALRRIMEHDNYKMVKNTRNRKMELFSMIESNSTPKMKFS